MANSLGRWLTGSRPGRNTRIKPKRHINPKYRAFGKARIDIASRVKTQADWDNLWKEPTYAFPFSWDSGWRQCIEYKVDDFAAEVGFFIDFLGLEVQAFGPEYAMFTGPGVDFHFGVTAAQPGEHSTPADALRIQFMLANLQQTVEELQNRGVDFEQEPQPSGEGSRLYVANFKTPHGILVDLWGEIEPEGRFEAPGTGPSTDEED